MEQRDFHGLLRDMAKVYEAAQSELVDLREEVHELRAYRKAQEKLTPVAVESPAAVSYSTDELLRNETNVSRQPSDKDERASVPTTPLPSLLSSQGPCFPRLESVLSPSFGDDLTMSSASESQDWGRRSRPRRQSVRQQSEDVQAENSVVTKQGSMRRRSLMQNSLSREADTARFGETEKAERLLRHFGECPDVSPESLMRALLNTGTHSFVREPITLELVEATLGELIRIAQAQQSEGEVMENLATSASTLPWPIFVELMNNPDLAEHALPNMAGPVSSVQTLLLSRQVHEVIEHGSDLKASESSMEEPQGMPWQKRLLTYIDQVVSAAIVTSIASMGLSLDNSPDALGWKVAEVIVASIFVAEVVLKLLVEGCREYFWGESKYWNWFDSALVTMALADLACEVLGASMGSTRMGLVLRGIRMTRILRLIRIFRSPMMKELSNLISGVATGLPALMWIIVVIVLFIYFCGIAGRQAFGPSEGSLVETCEAGDSYQTWDYEDPICKIHYVYGAEVCGSVERCMFTVFRCMLGDCTTAGGRSLTVILSEGYGLQFRLFYSVSMIITVFGLFNVVTAMMVESTISGLKYNEVQKRFNRIQEGKYVARKLELLVSVVTSLTTSYRQRRILRQLGDENVTNPRKLHDLKQPQQVTSLTPQELRYVFEHTDTKNVLADLEIFPSANAGLVDLIALYANDWDEVSVTDIVAVLLKLRGDVQKLDLVSLRESVCEIIKGVQVCESSIESSQENILQMIEELNARMPVAIETHVT